MKAEIVKCSCGDPVCTYYGLNIGHFPQGSGFDKETAERLAMMWDSYDLVKGRMNYATDEHAKILVKNADLIIALNKIASGSFQDASTLALNGSWQAFVERLQNIAKGAIDEN